ncbi:phosphoribosyltransferase family protein [Chitiniphilus shinanonensis]|uniref:phosphoribosyltransferase family protein n=2 Tax=Chitiniphilus shinanonensis TaxID=553088 RepID=UPI00305F4289
MNFLNNYRIRATLRSLADWRPPAACLGCGAACRDGLCIGCLDDLPALPCPCCAICAMPVPAGSVCGHCLAAPPAFATTHARFAYAGWLAQAIQAAKFGGRWHAFALLGRHLARALPAPCVDWVIPVPLAAPRLRERGFNQAQELAAALARAWRLPLRHDALLRLRDGAHQARSSRAARARNVRGAFAAPRPLDGTVLLVDDVMTSGASLHACARALREAGARRVECCVLARTL